MFFVQACWGTKLYASGHLYWEDVLDITSHLMVTLGEAAWLFWAPGTALPLWENVVVLKGLIFNNVYFRGMWWSYKD